MKKSEFEAWFTEQFGPTPNQTDLGREMELAEMLMAEDELEHTLRKVDIARLKWRAARDQWIRKDAALKAWNAARGIEKVRDGR